MLFASLLFVFDVKVKMAHQDFVFNSNFDFLISFMTISSWTPIHVTMAKEKVVQPRALTANESVKEVKGMNIDKLSGLDIPTNNNTLFDLL